jgi:hypothetical protein
MSIDAMKRALKTFEKIHEGCAFVKEDDLHKDAKDLATYVQEDCEFTMKTLRQAIEQAEEWDTSDMAHRPNGLAIDDDDIQEYKKPWVGLTDDEVHKIIDDCTSDEAELEELIDFSIAILVIEAKLKEKNT